MTVAKPPAKRPVAKATSTKKPQVQAKKGKVAKGGKAGKGRRGKKLQLKFHIDCRQPVEDGIMNAADFLQVCATIKLASNGLLWNEKK